MARPRTGETPIRHVRVSDKLWGKVDKIAQQQDRTKSEVVVDALEKYAAAELPDSADDD
jgi:predicted transcriptional regulator